MGKENCRGLWFSDGGKGKVIGQVGVEANEGGEIDAGF